MQISSKQEILDVLHMDDAAFEREIKPLARQIYIDGGNQLIASAMLGYSNICRSQCLYCGMRAGSKIERYRMPVADVKQSIQQAHDMGLRRIFFVSGEDPKYNFDELIDFLAFAKKLGFFVTLGAGELEREQFEKLREIGVDEYAMKFEMSDRETFNRLNPSTDYDMRMQCIGWIQELGFQLASGNIIDYPGHTPDQLADDILLMRELDISWAPIIPYLPAAGTPLAGEGGPGRLGLLYREIAILRLMMPKLRITAQQPGRDLTKGLADTDGNVAAIEAGANVLFVDLLPDALANNFRVIDNRSQLRFEHIREIAGITGMQLRME